MQKIKYSSLENEAKEYWDWSQNIPIAAVPIGVAREGAGSEMRTPIMHYGVVLPVYLSVIRYLREISPKKSMRLIELGSGSGRVLTYIKILFPELEVWGVDYSASGVAYAKKTYGQYGVKFKHTHAQDTSLKAEYFDFVISSHVIEHVTKDEGLLFVKEAHRLLKKGGYAFIGTPERKKCQDLYMENPTEDKKRRLVPPHEHEYTSRELELLGQKVFSASNAKVDMLLNPVFHKAFKSSIDKFRPKGTITSKIINVGYKTLRDKTPRPFFDVLTRVGAASQMRKFGISYYDILLGNSLANKNNSTEIVADNLLLIALKI